jgi:hypothetical protein
MKTFTRVLGTLIVFTACSFVFVMAYMYYETERQEAIERECVTAFRDGGVLAAECSTLFE